jgi:large subunit ribosomal protein L23
MDASQVIIRPVVSEKSFVLAEAGKYTFRVHDKAHKTQIVQVREGDTIPIFQAFEAPE